MTTSGHQTTSTTGPLDLRTKRRHGKVIEEPGGNPSESEKASSRNDNSMDNGTVKVEEMFVHSQGGPGHTNGTRKVAIQIQHSSRSTVVTPVNERTLKADHDQEDKDCPIHLAPVKCEMDTSTASDCNSKTTDQTVSKLPFRKRPFPVGQEICGPSWMVPPESKCPRTSKNAQDGGSVLVKSSRRSTPENGAPSQVQVQPVPMNGQGDRRPAVDPYQHMPAIAPYISYPVFPGFPTPSMIINLPTTPIPFLVRPQEGVDHLSIDAATWQDEDGDTALHIAVVQGQEALVHRLIHTLVQAHRNLDIHNNLRQTPLHLAVITNQVTLVEALLRAGSDPGTLDRHGQTAAHLCCEHGLSVCLERVLSLPSPLACLEAHNYEGLTPLHLAVQNRNKNLVKLLLNSRADIDAMDLKSGRSPLMHAVENNNIEMVSFLIEHGCNVNAQSYSGNTALHSACGRGQVDVVRALLRNGADSSLKNYHNDTALMVAKNKKVTDVLRGKGSRSQNIMPLENSSEPSSPHPCTPLSQQHSPNGTPGQSPIHTHHRSPLATHSPSALPNHCPFTQSTDSQPEEKDLQQQMQLVVVHPSMMGGHSQRMPYPILPVAQGCTPYQSSIVDCHIGAVTPSYTPSHTSGIPRTIYLSPSFIPGSFPYPASHGPPFYHGQSRPSSHSSDQSDASTMSISSDGKGES